METLTTMHVTQARSQWEVDNTLSMEDTAPMSRKMALQYIGVSIGSFAFGLFIKKKSREEDARKAAEKATN